MCIALLSNIEDEKTLTNIIRELDVKQMSESSELQHFLPTAIVKPKYQKLSFDERQLPSCGATITETPRKIQKHLPALHKSLPRRACSLTKTGGTVGNGEKRNSLVANMNTVAIVQPLENKIASSQNKKNLESETTFGEENNLNISIGNDMRKPECRAETRGRSRISGESK